MLLMLTGAGLLSVILFLFWLKDELRSPLLARFVYSALVARLAVLGAAFVIIGLLLVLSDLSAAWSAG